MLVLAGLKPRDLETTLFVPACAAESKRAKLTNPNRETFGRQGDLADMGEFLSVLLGC
jgi:hypothetical protein